MNHDKANQVEVGEGPKAADAALQRIVRSCEAAEAEAPFDIENVGKFLGDLDLGADVGSTEVIDDLGELDFAGENVLGEQMRAALADIDKLAETDPKAADAALQRMARAGEAREAEALEAETHDAEAPSDIESVEALLGDLDLGADAGSTEAIEHVHGVDVAPEDTVEGAIAKADAYEAQDVRDEARKARMELQKQMRATCARLNGGLDIASDDPLANDKRRVANTLKKVGRTLSDLPRDWDTLARTAIDGQRSRQSEFLKVLEAGREEMHQAERLRELKMRGRPANYDLLPRNEKDRIDTNARQRRHRDKMPKPSAKLTVTLPIADVGPKSLRGALIKMSRSLENWALYRDTPRARQLRKPEQQKALIRTAAIYAWHFISHGKPPSHIDLAKRLRCNKDQARRKLDVLKSLYAPGGPWASA